MEYPLIIDGVEFGKLSIESSGLYTLVDAWTEPHEQLIRLWLHGGGKCAYLGVMQPWSGGLYLHRKLSRRELKDFPETPEFASNQETPSLHNSEPKQASPPLSCPYPAPIEADSQQLQWFLRPDGSLVSFDGLSCLIALPANLRKPNPQAVLKRIDGKDYMLFRY